MWKIGGKCAVLLYVNKNMSSKNNIDRIKEKITVEDVFIFSDNLEKRIFDLGLIEVYQLQGADFNYSVRWYLNEFKNGEFAEEYIKMYCERAMPRKILEIANGL